MTEKNMLEKIEDFWNNFDNNSVKLSKEYQIFFGTFQRVQLRIIKNLEKFPREFPKLEKWFYTLKMILSAGYYVQPIYTR